MSKSKSQKEDLIHHYERHVKASLPHAPWLLRITEHKDKPVPLFIVKERIYPNAEGNGADAGGRSHRERRGLIYGQAQRRCLPVLRNIVSRVEDEAGIPLELHRFLSGNSIDFRGNLPLDDEAGYKLGLIFKLRERIRETNRVELIARRVERFTREEAAYWHSRMTNFSDDANRWAQSGMRTMLGGQPDDPGVEKMLQQLRSTY